MSDVYHIELPDGRVVGIEASSPQEAAQGARNIVARDKGEKAGKEGGIDNFVRSLARGGSLGIADEIAAAGDATVGPILDLILGKLGAGSTNTSTGPTWSQRYDENLGLERAQDKAYDAENPVASTTGKLVGGVGGAIATLPRALLQTPTLLRAAGAGGLLGGVTGFNEGEGGIVPRLESGAEGAGIGAILGPTIQAGADKIVSPVLRAAATSGPGQAAINNVGKPGALKIADLLDLLATRRPGLSASAAAPEGGSLPGGLLADIADMARSAPSGEDVVRRAAGERLATAAQRAKMSPEQIRSGLTDVGDVGVLADVDPQFMSMARVAQTMPGETKSIAPKILDERAKGAGPRLRSAIEGDQPPPSDFQLTGERQGFDSYRRAVAQRAYGAMEDAGFKNSPGTSRLMGENPEVAAAVDRVMKSEKGARAGTDREPASVVDLMHKVKREIENIGLDANGRPSSTAIYWQQTGDEFVSALKSANPELAAADRAFQAAASLPEFYQAGAGFMRGGLSETARKSGIGALDDILGGADPLQVLSARAGATAAAREETGGKIARAIGLARLIEESPDVRTKMVQLYGGERAQEIFRAAQAELRMNKTRGDILSGSQSTNKAAELFDNGLDTGNLGVRVSPGGIVPRFVQHFSDIARRVTAPNETVRNEIGRMTLSPDQVKNMQTIELIDEIMRQRARGRTMPASTGGVLGGQIPAAFGP